MIDIESRLHADGARWRDQEQADPPDIDVGHYANVVLDIRPVTRSSSRSRRWAVSGLVAAAVVALLVTFTLTRTHTSNQNPAVSSAPLLALPTAPASTDALRPPAASAVARIGLPPAKPVKQISHGSDVISMPWALTAISKDGTQLTVLYTAGDGDCHLPAGFDVRQSSVSVELIAVSTTKVLKSPQDACASMLVLGQGIVTLNAPLGDRVLLHAPADPNWSATLQSTLDQLH